jgi:hypothetical protein
VDRDNPPKTWAGGGQQEGQLVDPIELKIADRRTGSFW